MGAETEGSTWPAFEPSTEPVVAGCRGRDGMLLASTVLRDGDSDRVSLVMITSWSRRRDAEEDR